MCEIVIGISTNTEHRTDDLKICGGLSYWIYYNIQKQTIPPIYQRYDVDDEAIVCFTIKCAFVCFSLWMRTLRACSFRFFLFQDSPPPLLIHLHFYRRSDCLWKLISILSQHTSMHIPPDTHSLLSQHSDLRQHHNIVRAKQYANEEYRIITAWTATAFSILLLWRNGKDDRRIERLDDTRWKKKIEQRLKTNKFKRKYRTRKDIFPRDLFSVLI